MILILLALVIAALVVTAPLTGLDYQLRRIVRFQRRRNRKVTVPTFLSAAQRSKRQVPLTSIRDLVVNLQLGTAMEASLSGALVQAAEQFGDRGPLGERLQRHVEARLSMSPEAVLEGLVEDFDSTHLAELLERVRMVAEGGVSYDRVLALTADEIQEDIRGALELRIRKAPTRLSAIMMGGLFVPVLVLGMLPLAVSIRM